MTIERDSRSLCSWTWLALGILLSACGGGGGGGTADTVAPTVTAVDPPDTAVGSLVAEPVTAVFSELLDAATLNVNSFVLVGPDGPVSGTVGLSGSRASFTPDLPLAWGTDYEATLTTEVTDAAGNALASPRSWRFNTGHRLNANFTAHTCARFEDARVKCWGLNSQGQLGIGSTETQGDEPGEMGANLAAVDLGSGRRALDVGVGSNFTCALLDDRRVKCWGGNGSARLGLGDHDDRGDEPGEMGDDLPTIDLGSGAVVLQLSVGATHVCVRLQGGAVKCWGSNATGQLGLGDAEDRGDEAGEMGDGLAAVDLGTGRTATQITAADRYTCALLDNANLKCWGFNSDGDLGLGDSETRGDEPGEMGDALPVVDLGSGRTAVELAMDEHNCAILDDGSVKCWGYNNSGQLGAGDTDTRGTGPGEMGDALPVVAFGSGRSAASLALGSRHGCVILEDGGVKCWGGNFAGQLGLGDSEDRGNEPGEMGDALDAVDLGSGLTARGLTAGDAHVCADLSDGSVKCWGNNFAGTLGQGDTEARGDQPGEMGDNLPAVDLGS